MDTKERIVGEIETFKAIETVRRRLKEASNVDDRREALGDLIALYSSIDFGHVKEVYEVLTKFIAA